MLFIGLVFTVFQGVLTLKISTLTQGMFVGAISDNFDEHIDQKIFHTEIVVDNEWVSEETKIYQKIPQILSFVNIFGEIISYFEYITKNI